MSTPTVERPGVVRFFESFLQEKNIRWMLLSGLAILLGSSLVLVTSHWNDWSPISKYLSIIVYTLAAYAGGRIVCDYLRLPKTGTTLLALVVLLIPITFYIPNQIFAASSATFSGNAVALALLLMHAGIASIAAVDICRRLMGRWQPTFIASYLLLSFAGVAIPYIPSGLEFMTLVGLWSVMSLGSIKINRHVFWMTEEHRAPRIVGFLPILLLGAEFAGLATFLVPTITISWFGPIVVLIAVPIYFTAESLLKVFQQRTGGLVHPLPISIILPIFLSTVFALSGIILSATTIADLTQRVPFLLSTALASGIFISIGLRFRQSMFVYASLISIIFAYAFIPALNPTLTEQAKVSISHILGMTPLPLSLRGFCYLPLIGIFFLMERRWNTTLPFIARPIWNVTSILSITLLLFALTESKAWFLVGAPFTFVFLYQGLRSRHSSFLIPAVISWLMTWGGFSRFLELETNVALPLFAKLTLFTVADGCLLVGLRSISRRFEDEETISRLAGGVTYVIGAAIMVATFMNWDVNASVIELALVGGSMTALLLVQNRFRPGYELATIAIIYSQLFAVTSVWSLTRSMDAFGSYSTAIVFAVATAIGLMSWTAYQFLHEHATTPFRRGFFKAFATIAPIELAGLLGLIQAIHLYDIGVNQCSHPSYVELVDISEFRVVWMILLVTLTGWGLQASYILRSRMIGMIASTGLLILTAVAATFFVQDLLWVIPAVAIVAMIMMLIGDLDRHSSAAASSLLRAMSLVGLTTLIGTSLIGLSIYEIPCLAAASVAVVAWIIESYRTRIPSIRMIALLLLHLHVATIPFLLMGGTSLPAISLPAIMDQPLAYADAYPWLVLILWGGAGIWVLPQFKLDSIPIDLRSAVQLLINVLGIFAIVASFFDRSWSVADSILVLSASWIRAIGQLESARRNESTEEVGLSWGIALSTLPLLVVHGVISIGTPWSPIVLASVGIGLTGIASIFEVSRRYRIAAPLTRYLSHASLLSSVIVAAVREFAFAPLHTGLNSIALLIVATFYFARWIETNERWSLLSGAGLSNLALAFTAVEMNWTDPQVFMIPMGATILLLVEVLRKDIPVQFHAPLRYAGSLLVLMSPLWHILDGGWLPYFTLMAASTAVTLVAMGLRIRSLLYIGAAFLMGDLTAILVRGCFDHPDLLWLAGIGLGTTVLLLAAICERKREQIVIRIQNLSAALQQWK